jgi:hypothetical protein
MTRLFGDAIRVSLTPIIENGAQATLLFFVCGILN